MQHNTALHSCLQRLYIYLIIASTLVSCTKDKMSECAMSSVSYKLTIKAFDADNTDITSSEAVKEAKLYIFDGSKNYLATQDATVGKTVELHYPNYDQLYVVVWGNSAGGNQMMPLLMIGDKLKTAFVSLNKTKTLLPIVQSPDDIFYGAIELTKESQNIETEVAIRRKTSSVVITARKLKEFAAVSDNNFSYILRKSSDKLDFYGMSNGIDVSYLPDVAFDSAEQFVSPIFNILSTTTYIEIDIYHDSVLLATVVCDSSGKKFKTVEGKLLNVLIDFNAEVSVIVAVTAWGKQQIWKEF